MPLGTHADDQSGVVRAWKKTMAMSDAGIIDDMDEEDMSMVDVDMDALAVVVIPAMSIVVDVVIVMPDMSILLVECDETVWLMRYGCNEYESMVC